jgi:GTPase-activating protein
MYDTTVSYCQGMNYSMGFLQLHVGDPDLAFRCFCKMMNLYLKNLFEKEFDLLKKYFFKFTRIMELFLPDLAEHFQVFFRYFLKKKL